MTIHSFNMTMELAGKAVLGYRRAKKEQWISTSTWDKIDQRKGIKKKLLTTKSPRLKERLSREYSQKDKEVKRKKVPEWTNALTLKTSQKTQKQQQEERI